MKKAISILLCLCLVFSVFTVVPFSATAAETEQETVGASSGTTGECSWTLNKGVLTISGNGAMGDYEYNSTLPWGNEIKSVIINSGVTSIGDCAFNTCFGLTSVNIPDSVTSIGNQAFSGCFGLTSVIIGNSVTSIDNKAFYRCTGLTSVTIPDNVMSIGDDAFNFCTELASVTISDSVTSIGAHAFGNTAWYKNQPNGLVYAGKIAYKYKGTMPDDTSIVIRDGTKEIAGSAFYNCFGLTSVNIPDSVMSIGEKAFCFCTNLTSVIIPDSVTSIGDKALGYYIYNNVAEKVSGFTIYGTPGSEAEIYAENNGFIFKDLSAEDPTEEPTEETTEAADDTLTVDGISNYCQAVEAQEIEVDELVIVTFKAPEARDIVDIQLGMNYDKDMLMLAGINTFDHGSMLFNTNADSFNVLGSLSDINNPYHVATGDEFVTFIFIAKDTGQTIVDLRVIDMTLRIYGEDYIYIENGEIKTICTHNTTRTTPGYPATCTEEGLTDEIVCVECGKVLAKADAIPAKGHTPAIDQAKAPTCTETGLTEGSHCSVCNETIVSQKVIPAGHTIVIDEAKAATCTETGLTEGSHCSVCGEVLVEQTDIPALGHSPIIDPYLAPTCQHEGHTIGSYCERCGEVYVASETIPKLSHTIVVDEAVASKCGQTGLTEGSHCSVCGEVIVAQQEVPALQHEYEIVPAVSATYAKEGATDGVRCKHCGEWLIEPQVIPRKTIDFTFGDINNDGKIDIRDVTMIQRCVAEIVTLSEQKLGAADVNFDGVVDINDATHLQMYLAEYGVTLG